MKLPTQLGSSSPIAAVGNRLSEAGAGTRSYTYDPANRLTSVNGTTYTDDAYGNLLNEALPALPADGSLTYTAANRLRSTTEGKNRSTYLYDGLGNRLAQTTDGTTTEYVLDIVGGLPDVMAALRCVYQVVDANWNVIQSTNYTRFSEVMESEGEQSAAGDG